MINPIPSQVELRFLQETEKELRYNPEKIGVLVVESFPALGRLVAYRFLEWVLHNPEGVISLPTGKTPEYFIREVQRLLEGWNRKRIKGELEGAGVKPERKPDMRGLRFVQIDEFYPINPLHLNSFFYYVDKYYIRGFGLDRSRALLINCGKIGLPENTGLEEIWQDGKVDLDLRYRSGTNALEKLQKRIIARIDQWCTEYEEKIRDLGGIGFFLGGIGPDGHIGFNVRGSDFYSTTRLTSVNYETHAAAALDLGGMEVARKRLVITIGLATITWNRDCTAVIMAAGEAKKKIVADAIQQPRNNRYPATALQCLEGARFYVTRAAAVNLGERRYLSLANHSDFAEEQVDRIMIDISLETGKSLKELASTDCRSDRFGRLVLEKTGKSAKALAEGVAEKLIRRIENGMMTQRNTVFLHTEPHHDDVMLAYLPFVVRHVREWSNQHHFATLTSGFTAVTNQYMLTKAKKLKLFIKSDSFSRLFDSGYFEPKNRSARNKDVWQYLDGVASRSPQQSLEGEMRRLARDLIEIYDEKDPRSLDDRIDELINYFETQYPGRRDLAHIQRLKGMCREWESDCLWGYFGWNAGSVYHLRLGFYTGDLFTEEPTIQRDVEPIVRLLSEIDPDVVGVADDPEASGPDTHYKVMQAISTALGIHSDKSGRRDIEVLCYRNVWYRYHPSEANLYVPVSLNMFSLQNSAFMNTFLSQKDAPFPSYEHDGPFSQLAQQIQVDQFRMLEACLGEAFFNEHPSALIRATRGMVFLNRLSLEDFYSRSRELREATELPAGAPL
jgi:glucosamine-6-phosphate deaminase